MMQFAPAVEMLRNFAELPDHEAERQRHHDKLNEIDEFN